MPYRRPNLRPTTRTASTPGRRGRRAGLCAVLLTGFVTTAFAAGAVGPAAAADTGTGTTPATAAAQSEARVTTAVLDLDHPTAKPQLRGKDVPYDTASIVKVDILSALLLQAQDAGRGLTQQERTLAEAMIEHSDNGAANALWREIGQAPGLKAVNKRLGLSSTVGGAGGLWGLTRTTASDQIGLLRAVFAADGTASATKPALTTASRTYIRTLMTRIATDQSWGVSAASDSAWALKNGWLQRTTTGLWDVNSVGQVTSGTHHYLVAVLSDGNTSMATGIKTVENAARTAVTSARAAG
ncbi:serine hydrolase [Streptomyces sp. NPDC087856]|uniref:serine hydrolase n=1 Tax=Streptomyces sp. NPDC087856 TaxID=3365811 RepID=UPI0038276765